MIIATRKEIERIREEERERIYQTNKIQRLTEKIWKLEEEINALKGVEGDKGVVDLRLD